MPEQEKIQKRPAPAEEKAKIVLLPQDAWLRQFLNSERIKELATDNSGGVSEEMKMKRIEQLYDDTVKQVAELEEFKKAKPQKIEEKAREIIEGIMDELVQQETPPEFSIDEVAQKRKEDKPLDENDLNNFVGYSLKGLFFGEGKKEEKRRGGKPEEKIEVPFSFFKSKDESAIGSETAVPEKMPDDEEKYKGRGNKLLSDEEMEGLLKGTTFEKPKEEKEKEELISKLEESKPEPEEQKPPVEPENEDLEKKEITEKVEDIEFINELTEDMAEREELKEIFNKILDLAQQVDIYEGLSEDALRKIAANQLKKLYQESKK